MSEIWVRVPPLLAQHVLLAAAALALGIAISLPLGLWSARRVGVARVALATASLVQTVPSLALLALFYPVLLWLGHAIGAHVPALGFLPSLLALTLYSVLPILRNTVAGLTGIDAAVVEAADGVGMTARQRLWWVEVPLALPMVMAGVRTAAVWTIGAATLSTTVGQPSLGDLIFAGLQTQNWALVLVGCATAAGLALAADALLGLAERGARERRRWLVWASLLAVAAALLAALAPLMGGGERRVVIGAKNFSEQFILARLIGHRLERAGYRVEYRDGLGSAVAFGALAGGDVDVYVDYAGTIWTGQMHRADVPPRPAQVRAIGDWIARTHQGRLLGALGFENAYAFAMRPGTGVRTLDDLVARAPGMALGADLEFLDRAEWAAIRRAYPLRFRSATPYSPTFMYRALASARADVITAFSSDGRIAADKLTVLSDPKRAIPGYDAVLLVSPGRAGDARFTGALRGLIGRVPVEVMRRANYMVDRDTDKASPDAAARWIERAIDRR